MSKQIIIDYYKEEKDYRNYDDYDFSETEKRCIFFMDCIVCVTTYDFELSVLWGKEILETIKKIHFRISYDWFGEEYFREIKNRNILINWLDWGSSIRTAWFDGIDGKIEFYRYGSYEKNREIKIKPTKDFVEWLILWLEAKVD